ncbi:hypothetical protein ANME2D_02465 [Candidatus Methanoperedens nitroreducens]|uniref:Uncharacterized protein n=1 Tax=Candidatus Methanoperedens nitratireducens TaxID=1392998 RepID=A0A062V3Q2_9EURY|nr:hypothetical protein ANME2D_02465 [Candidatus Methanoperedens nitroreducens]
MSLTGLMIKVTGGTEHIMEVYREASETKDLWKSSNKTLW